MVRNPVKGLGQGTQPMMFAHGFGCDQNMWRLILPSARIFAVVDVYDALTSDRPYRTAWSQEKTLQHIREGSGSHFDPRVVDVFLQMIDEGG